MTSLEKFIDNLTIRRINIHGGPGSGKSTLAAAVYNYFKSRGHSIELVREYVKSWAWQNIKPESFDQLYITAKQLRSEDIVLRSGVEMIVTDSPLVTQLAYTPPKLFDGLQAIIAEFDKIYPCLDVYIKRGEMPYEEHGRFQNESEAIAIDEKIMTLLAGRPNFTIVTAQDQELAIDSILLYLGRTR